MDRAGSNLFYFCPEQFQCSNKYRTLEKLKKHTSKVHNHELADDPLPREFVKQRGHNNGRGRGGNSANSYVRNPGRSGRGSNISNSEINDKSINKSNTVPKDIQCISSNVPEFHVNAEDNDVKLPRNFGAHSASELEEVQLELFQLMLEIKNSDIEVEAAKAKLDACVSNSNKLKSEAELVRKKINSLVETNKGDDNLCVVCIDRPKTIAAVPCGHLCFCEECLERYNKIICPLCRKDIDKFVKIFY